MSEHIKSIDGEDSNLGIECYDCQSEAVFNLLQKKCPECASDWRFAHYGLSLAKKAFSDHLSSREMDFWRYAEVLPLHSPSYKTDLSEGWTPLFHDDDAEARQLIRRVLEAKGNYSICEADRGEAAMQAFDTEHPDLVTLDLMMPYMDGFEVLERLKAKSGPTDIPIIVVTTKELTTKELHRIRDRTDGLLIKGDFLGDDQVNHVDKVLD